MLLQYAMKIGLGRRSSVNPNRIEWQYSDLVFSAGISDRSLRNYRNSGELPSTTTFKRLLSVLLAEEGADAKAWELAFIEAWVREGLDINIATSVPQASQMGAGKKIVPSAERFSDRQQRNRKVGAIVSLTNLESGAYAPRDVAPST
jgi:hypothetical protein